jgi:hypothetical protein
VALGQTYLYAAHAIDADNDPLTYSLDVQQPGMRIDPITGAISWDTTGAQVGVPYNVTVRVVDGRGGYDLQPYQITVTDNPVPGTLTGTVYNDLNANGVRDAAYINGPTDLQPIDLQAVTLQHVPITVTYYEPNNSVIVPVSLNGLPSSSDPGVPSGTLLEQVLPDGTEVPFASLPDVTLNDACTIASVTGGNTAGFTAGDIFAPTAAGFGISGNQASIVRVTDGGMTVLEIRASAPRRICA